MAAVTLIACSDGSDVGSVGDSANSDDSGVRAIELDESRRLAETLFHNYELGGADFEVQGQMPDGTFVRMSGAVDWVAHSGTATVDISGTADAAVVEVVWGETVVLERIPALTELASAEGRSPTRWFARPPDTDGRHLDSMIELVTALASEQRENPGLIAQTEGTARLRSDVVPGVDVDVDVFRYGSSNRYWIEQDGVTLYRFEGNNSSSTRPVLVDLRDHGPRTTPVPLRNDVVELSEVADLHAQVVADLADSTD